MMVVVRSQLTALFVFLAPFISSPKCVNSLSVTKPPVGGRIYRRTRHGSLFTAAGAAPDSKQPSSTRLEAAAISPTATAVVWSAVGHVMGGASGAPIVATAIQNWYRKIDLPPWTPPDRVFAPTWTVLYAAMGIAAGRIYERMGGYKFSSFPLTLWAFHYLMNLAWAPVFFGLKRLRLGMAINYILLATLAVIIPAFSTIDPLSAVLLLPYMAWLVFATALNGAICRRNPTYNGYNNAMLQSDLYQLQQQAANYAGV